MEFQAIEEKNQEDKRILVRQLKSLKVKTDSIVNFLDLATLPLEPMQIKRRIVTLRSYVNRLMRTPQLIQNVELNTLTFVTEYEVEVKGEIEVQVYTSQLGGKINTRIETYKNKQVVHVFANIDSEFLKRKNFDIE